MLRDKLSPGTKPGFLKSEKMFRFKLLYIHKSVSENVYVTKIIIFGCCYSITYTLFILYCIWLVLCHICVADVIATVADVIAQRIFIKYYG